MADADFLYHGSIRRIVGDHAGLCGCPVYLYLILNSKRLRNTPDSSLGRFVSYRLSDSAV